MAKVINRIASQILPQCHNLSALQNIIPISSVPCTRQYSHYLPVFREPIIPRDEIKTVLRSEAFKAVELLPVKAALNYYSSSMFLDPKVMKFINYVMDDGKKLVARRVVGQTFTQIKRIQVAKWNRAKPENQHHIELDPLKIFHEAVKNGKPYLRIINIRLGPTWYQVPKPITEKCAEATSMKWFVELGGDKHKRKRFFKTLAKELIDASENRGRVINRKIELYKLCEANKTYAHFRWG